MLIEIIPNWHPIFVHFTVALFSTATVLFLLGAIASERKWAKPVITAASINLWLGALMTIATITTGLYAYNTVNHDAASHIAMTDHRNWALATAALFTLATLLSAKSINKPKLGVGFLMLLIVATSLLTVTAFKGGELVYRYGLGVISIPGSSESHSEDHNEGHSESHKDHQVIDHEDQDNQQDIKTQGHNHGHEHHDHTH